MANLKIFIATLSMLIIDLLYFFSKYPDYIERYTGYININNGNLHLLTEEIVHFRVTAFLFLICIPSLAVSLLIAFLIPMLEDIKNKIGKN